jgi:hypothetical protein
MDLKHLIGQPTQDVRGVKRFARPDDTDIQKGVKLLPGQIDME